MFNLQIDGLEELENAIGNMQRKISKMHKEALTAGATVIKDELHPNTPRSDKGQKHMQDDLDITRLRTDGDGLKYVAVGWPKSKSRKDTKWRIHFLNSAPYISQRKNSLRELSMRNGMRLYVK